MQNVKLNNSYSFNVFCLFFKYNKLNLQKFLSFFNENCTKTLGKHLSIIVRTKIGMDLSLFFILTLNEI